MPHMHAPSHTICMQAFAPYTLWLTRLSVCHAWLQHKLWLYDARAGKRPQMELDWGKARVTALAAQADGGWNQNRGP